MGQSGGTFFGIQAAAGAQERGHAYIAIAQISNQLDSERLAHHYMLRRYGDEGNHKMARRLEDAPVGDAAPLPDAYLSVRDVAMHELGVGTTRDMNSVFTDMFRASLRHRGYTLGEKIKLWRGKRFSEAPMKGFYAFKQSAHTPFFEE